MSKLRRKIWNVSLHFQHLIKNHWKPQFPPQKWNRLHSIRLDLLLLLLLRRIYLHFSFERLSKPNQTKSKQINKIWMYLKHVRHETRTSSIIYEHKGYSNRYVELMRIEWLAGGRALRINISKWFINANKQTTAVHSVIRNRKLRNESYCEWESSIVTLIILSTFISDRFILHR